MHDVHKIEFLLWDYDTLSPLSAAPTVVAVVEALKQSPHSRHEGSVASPAEGLDP